MATALFLVFIILSSWLRRSDIAEAWRQRHLFPISTYWGVAAMYALSGFIPMFSAFWTPHLHIQADSGFMQTLTAVGLVSLVVVHLAARKLAKPQFEAHDIPAKQRNEFHGLWMGFWLVGFAFGFLPVLLS